MTAPFALPNARRYALRQARVLGRSLPKPEGPLDFDGFATVDILVDDGAIAKIAPAGVADFGDAPQVALSGRIVLPLFVDAHTHHRQGPHLAAQTQSRRRLPERARRGNRRPVGQLERGRRRRADGIQPALRLRSRYDRAAHPHRQRRRRRRGSAGRFSRRRASAGETGSTLQAAPIFSVDFALDRSHMADIEAMLEAHGTGILGAVTYMVPRLREGLDDAVRACGAQGLGA